MAEENGTIIIKAPLTILNKLTTLLKNPVSVIVELAEYSSVDFSALIDINIRMSDCEISGDYAKIYFDCSEWHTATKHFIRHSSNIEWYARIQDEYGCCYFYSLNNSGAQFAFEFDQGSELFDNEDYEDEVMSQLDRWVKTIPDDLVVAFPEFTDTSNLIFDGP